MVVYESFKKWAGKLLNNQDIDLRLKIKPFATIGFIIVFAAVGGTSFSIGRYLFPNSSPILHREVNYQGVIQKTDSGQYYLTLADNTIWTLKPKSKSNVNFQNLQSGQAFVRGNLTWDSYVIEVSEVIPLDNSNSPAPIILTSPQNSTLVDEESSSSASSVDLPVIYSGLQWEKTQKKLLTFTSGKRRIEQEGLYFESALVKEFPQDFINYYLQELKQRGFKETLNSISPEGLTITYSKGDLFLTFGIKYKKSGYTAFIEHN